MQCGVQQHKLTFVFVLSPQLLKNWPEADFFSTVCENALKRKRRESHGNRMQHQVYWASVWTVGLGLSHKGKWSSFLSFLWHNKNIQRYFVYQDYCDYELINAKNKFVLLLLKSTNALKVLLSGSVYWYLNRHIKLMN